MHPRMELELRKLASLGDSIEVPENECPIPWDVAHDAIVAGFLSVTHDWHRGGTDRYSLTNRARAELGLPIPPKTSIAKELLAYARAHKTWLVLAACALISIALFFAVA